ncbi:MAG: methylated-DNA--[protein]-cysteine S-methyltransferase [Bacillota bacterium]|nr:methylated-DNA--[protein]-cysteine S-methyltransferase [Bacillota bacterium]
MYVVELGLEACSAETPEPSRNGRNALTDCVYEQVQCYLQGMRREFDFPICLRGTDFQKRVWKALCEIPYGETRSYKEIAEAVGNPKACRAVGGANNKNPIAVAVPCHRVIGSDGSLVGYGLGTGLKKILLDLERKTERIATEKKENGVVKS